MNFKVSFWEKETFMKDPDVIIVGGGIVGLNCALSIKEISPEIDVLVIDRGAYPIGASTRNAGFACFGSLTEILDDLKVDSEENVFALMTERLKGLNYLRKRVGDAKLEYRAVGGYEVFDPETNTEELTKRIVSLNKTIFNSTGIEDTFTPREAPFPFKKFSTISIFNRHEGSLHPGKMMFSLYHMAEKVGIRFLKGVDVTNIEESEEGVTLECGNYSLRSRKTIVCTNGFTNLLNFSGISSSAVDQASSNLELTPARNQVLLTEEIPGLALNSCFHYDKGYVYFRNVGNRILIGGGRNFDGENELTAFFGSTLTIRKYLKDILYNRIGIDRNVKIDYEWSGIMGIGPVKSPVLRKHSEHIIFAVRLGGMGIALGALVGDKAAKLLLNDIKN